MTRILGSHFNAGGEPKRGYATESVAKREAARFGKAYYRCDVCDQFHLTSETRAPGRGRASARRGRRRSGRGGR